MKYIIPTFPDIAKQVLDDRSALLEQVYTQFGRAIEVNFEYNCKREQFEFSLKTSCNGRDLKVRRLDDLCVSERDVVSGLYKLVENRVIELQTQECLTDFNDEY